MSKRLHGAGGTPGIALGMAARLRVEGQPGGQAGAEPPEAALARFGKAQTAAVAQLRALAEQLRQEGSTDEAGIFDAHALLAEDPFLNEEVARRVSQEHQPLAQAVSATIGQMRDTLAALDDEYLRARAADIDAVGLELLEALRGPAPAPLRLPPNAILIAPDLSPAQIASLRGGAVAGFATAHGGPTSHTAILARSLGIPAVIGAGLELLDLADATLLIVDGDARELVVEPDAEERAAYTRRRSEQQQAAARRIALRDQPGRLRDGHPVSLWANIGAPAEAQTALAEGARGIGLFRTEFLFLDREAPPSEAEQFIAYRSVLQTMGGYPVIIRTIDIGGDKEIPYLDLPREPNPFLGERALRLCMRRPDLFATQLRALLRAAVYGDLRIMLPMVATPEDLAWGRAQLRAAAQALEAAGLPHRADIPLGVMIETPAAAVTADLLAREAAFFSIGSNDLTQYSMAADRSLGDLALRYPHSAPAVLRLIRQTSQAAAQAGISISVCGDLAGSPDLVPALVGLGVQALSMSPAQIPLIKERLG